MCIYYPTDVHLSSTDVHLLQYRCASITVQMCIYHSTNVHLLQYRCASITVPMHRKMESICFIPQILNFATLCRHASPYDR